MSHGFYIVKLEVRGTTLNSKPAILEFEPGFNLVTGGSDTGKSYAFSTLEFMLGKIESPTHIPESSGYINFYLEIKTYQHITYTIFRKLGSDNYVVKQCTIAAFFDSNNPEETLSVHPTATKNISDFLLKLCGFEIPLYIKSNQQNGKRKFTFNILRNLTFVDESTITVKSSPFYGNQSYVDYTLCKNLLTLLLTGENANDIVSNIDKEQLKSWTKGKLDFVKSQIIHFSDTLEKLFQEKLSIENIDSSEVDNLKIKFENLNQRLINFTELKSDLIDQVQNMQSSLIYNTELLERLKLLKDHYESDQERLEFILEGEQLISQLSDAKCPICESLMDAEKIAELSNTKSIRQSIINENQKIKLKIHDLTDTIQANQRDTELLIQNLNLGSEKLKETDILIQNELSPSLDNLRAEIANKNVVNDIEAKMFVYAEELKYYQQEQEGLEAELKKEIIDGTASDDGNAVIKLSITLKRLLENWKYEDDEINLAFNNNHKIFDFVISEKPRGSYGKGMRSISFTAVIISIMKYCLSNSKPFSNLLVFDSPLTTYHKGQKPDSTEKIDEGIQEAFFKDLALIQKNCQIIVFDNKYPSNDIANKINLEYFTKDKNSGRYGLFPIDN